MDKKDNKHSNKLWMVIELSQILSNNNCTYKQSVDILSLLLDEIKEQQKCKEYDTFDDYCKGIKSKKLDSQIIKPLNHVPEYNI